ncbi:Hypothetical predicted protein [Mytilus galloprovincialis]|uniref:VWFA domain-containing protein n=1 Tax=Mytilus galloprovincialis TaxID=29158 RepID=A0A8B6C5U9_MYTGA|nr:Hypothetical predicted protein [Mytilus galloprovincialis]
MKRTIPEAEEARRKGIHIYSIGIGLTDTAEVFAIATPPSENNSFIIQNFNELSGLDKTIFSSICQDKMPLLRKRGRPYAHVTYERGTDALKVYDEVKSKILSHPAVIPS